ncbi:MAG: class I SAM-dependent methyltransferase [Syntrophomonas sp.]
MKEDQISLTAIMCAYLRAFHAMNDHPKIFDDFLAYRIIPEERRALIEQGFANAAPPEDSGNTRDRATAIRGVMQFMGLPNILSRSRYTEDALEKAIMLGVKQYVILGAGMDTFAFRHPEMLDELRVFEIDHPAMQAFKRERLAELGWEKPEHLNFVPVDFTKDSLSTALEQSSYDPQSKSFFCWLGVTMYLTRDEVFATLRSIADIACAGSSVVFDYFHNDAFIPSKGDSKELELREKLHQMGEPQKTGFDPAALASDIMPLGLRLHENLGPSDIQERYFQGQTDGYCAAANVHLAWAVIE